MCCALMLLTKNEKLTALILYGRFNTWNWCLRRIVSLLGNSSAGRVQRALFTCLRAFMLPWASLSWAEWLLLEACNDSLACSTSFRRLEISACSFDLASAAKSLALNSSVDNLHSSNWENSSRLRVSDSSSCLAISSNLCLCIFSDDSNRVSKFPICAVKGPILCCMAFAIMLSISPPFALELSDTPATGIAGGACTGNGGGGMAEYIDIAEIGRDGVEFSTRNLTFSRWVFDFKWFSKLFVFLYFEILCSVSQSMHLMSWRSVGLNRESGYFWRSSLRPLWSQIGRDD